MRWTILSVVFSLAACTKPPTPVPTEIERPKPVRIKPADVSALKATIASSRAKLAAYQALPPCAPSGAVECRDDDRAGEAATAERNATEALSGLQGSRSRLPAAKQRARALRDAVKNLTGD